MQTERIHFYMSASMIIAGFFVLFALFSYEPKELGISGMLVSEKPMCEDGTPLKTCSFESMGNMCVMSDQGPRLEYSAKCYETPFYP